MTDLSGFYKLSVADRLKRIKELTNLTDQEISILSNSGALSLEQADKTVENVIGAVHLPLGIATNFIINGKEIPIPIAVEEPSVIAAACKGAKQTLPVGFKADADESIMIGQIQIVQIPNIKQAKKDLTAKRADLLAKATDAMQPHIKYGCEVRDLESRIIKTARGDMLIVEFHICVGDAKGANMINSTIEHVSPMIANLTGGKVRLRILSNLAVHRKVRASAIWKKEIVGEEVIEGVLDAYEFAKNDPFRCATHNKGIMNGIDPVVVATGNDWRSSEASAHSFAAIDGYHSLTKYHKNKSGDLVGEIELPLAVATVGPAVNSSPTAKIALKIMGIKTSRELAMIMACVGLSNNFAAMAALSTVGIQQGHMKLHARSVAVQAGATSEECEKVAEILSKEKNFTMDRAKEVIAAIRKK